MLVSEIFVLETVDNKPVDVLAGRIELVGDVLTATPATADFTDLMNSIVSSPLYIEGIGEINAKDDPGAFIDSLHNEYRSAYLRASQATRNSSLAAAFDS